MSKNTPLSNYHLLQKKCRQTVQQIPHELLTDMTQYGILYCSFRECLSGWDFEFFSRIMPLCSIPVLGDFSYALAITLRAVSFCKIRIESSVIIIWSRYIWNE